MIFFDNIKVMRIFWLIFIYLLLIQLLNATLSTINFYLGIFSAEFMVTNP